MITCSSNPVGLYYSKNNQSITTFIMKQKSAMKLGTLEREKIKLGNGEDTCERALNEE